MSTPREAPRRRARKWPWFVGIVVVLFVVIVSLSNSPNAAPTAAAPVAAAPVAAAPVAPAPQAPGFGDGTYEVGKTIPPGTYKSAGPVDGSGIGCYWVRMKDTSGELNSIITSDIANGPVVVTIKPSDGAFKSSHCQNWTKS